MYYDIVTDKYLFGQMIGDGVATKEEDTQRQAGDRITISWLERLSNIGLIGNQVATGNEQNLNYFTDQIFINQLRNPVEIPGLYTIDYQRVNYDLNADTYRVLSDWHKQRMIVAAFNQLCGNTSTAITYDGQVYTGSNLPAILGLNPAIAPSTAGGVQRIYYANPSSNTTDQAVGADPSATMRLDYILDMEVIAETQRPYIRPISEFGMIKYHFYCHTEVYNQLLQDASSSNQYRELNLARVTAGKSDGEIMDSFVWSRTKIIKSDKLPQGVNSVTSLSVPNTRRGAFCGREALGFALGRGYSEGGETVAGFVISRDFFDIGQQQRIAMSGIYGMKKVLYNGIDHGVIVMVTYSSI
jgi:hypothetical protein